jgi:catechol 2,3-dioxygenase-like lactoylglutathione lyase family enzyme
MPNLNGLLEAALFVENLSRARDFYQQVVGLEKLQESEAGCVFVVAKGQLLLLISHEKAGVPSKTPGGEVPPCVSGAGETIGAGHIAFAVVAKERVGDLQALLDAQCKVGGRQLIQFEVLHRLRVVAGSRETLHSDLANEGRFQIY